MHALVTGGGGFIGSHVVRRLCEAGHRVRVLHLPRENLMNLAGLDVELVAGDVTDAARMNEVVAGCDHVFHLAAIYALWLRNPERMREVNVEGTRNVLRAAAGAKVRRVVFTSSIAVFGGQGIDLDATEASPFRLGSTGDPYAASKHESHLVAEDFARGGLDVTIVAPTGPLGPGDVGPTPTGQLLLAIANLPVVFVVDSASSFIDVRDVAEGHVLAAERGKRGESYLLGAENLRVKDLVRLTLDVLGQKKPIVTVSPGAARLAARALVAIAQRTGTPPLITPTSIAIAQLGLRASPEKAIRELGLSPRPVAAAVRDALQWFAEHGYIKPIWPPRRASRPRGGIGRSTA